MPESQQEKALKIITSFTEELGKIVEKARTTGDFEVSGERLKRWKERAVKETRESINPIEAENLEKKRKGSFLMGQPLRNLIDEVDMYRGFLMALAEDIKDHPDTVLSAGKKDDNQDVTPGPPAAEQSTNVFLVHGHDELNMLKLKDLLREKWHLNPIVLQKKPGKGRTLIEKFLEEAESASFAVALFTPDDVVGKGEETYLQARPNTIFELGWFFGRLGRGRVCIFVQKGTEVLSDIKGLSVIYFKNSVDEKILELEEELKGAGLIQ